MSKKRFSYFVYRILVSDVFLLVVMSMITIVTAVYVCLMSEGLPDALWIVGVMVFVNALVCVLFWLNKRKRDVFNTPETTLSHRKRGPWWKSVASRTYSHAEWLDKEALLTQGPVDWDKPPQVKS